MNDVLCEFLQSLRHFRQLSFEHFCLFPQSAHLVLFVLPLGGKLAVTVLNAFGAWGSPPKLAAQVLLQGGAYGAIGPGYGLDTVLLKEGNGPAAHPAGEHHVCPLLVDEAWHLTWSVVTVEGIGDILDSLDLSPLQVHQDKVWAAPKVGADDAFQPPVTIC